MKKNEKGEVILTDAEVGAMSRADLASALRAYNRYRRGEGEYTWSEDPEKNKEFLYDPGTLGLIIEACAKTIEEN